MAQELFFVSSVFLSVQSGLHFDPRNPPLRVVWRYFLSYMVALFMKCAYIVVLFPALALSSFILAASDVVRPSLKGGMAQLVPVLWT